MKRILLTFVCSAALASCVGVTMTHRVIASSPKEIQIEFDRNGLFEGEAIKVARKHCSQYGARAVLQDEYGRYRTYSCASPKINRVADETHRSNGAMLKPKDTGLAASVAGNSDKISDESFAVKETLNFSCSMSQQVTWLKQFNRRNVVEPKRQEDITLSATIYTDGKVTLGKMKRGDCQNLQDGNILCDLETIKDVDNSKSAVDISYKYTMNLNRETGYFNQFIGQNTYQGDYRSAPMLTAMVDKGSGVCTRLQKLF